MWKECVPERPFQHLAYKRLQQSMHGRRPGHSKNPGLESHFLRLGRTLHLEAAGKGLHRIVSLQ